MKALRGLALLCAAAAAGCSAGVSGPGGALAAGAAAYYVLDPLGPDWRARATALGGERYRIELREKRFASGGDGEAEEAFRRCAERLARAHGRRRYEVLAYTEGVDSSFPVAQRVARGTVRLAP